MTGKESRTAIVTGATSGLGFESAAQLAEQGYARVIATGRTETKIADAVSRLESRTALSVFEPLVIDNDDLATVEAAVAELDRRGGQVDLAIWNAGVVPAKELVKTESGLEATVASTLIGHHLLTVRLLERSLLADGASIVIAGSEAARGDVPTFHPVDLEALASDHFDGDLAAAIEAQIRMDAPAKYKPGDTYATAKVFVAWWAAQLARVLPEGMSVNAVSPGSTPDTNAVNGAPFYMRKLMVPMFKLLPGMSHSVADGAGRYLEVADYDSGVTGKFFASRPKKMTGPLAEVNLDHIDNQDAQRALWKVTSDVSGGVNYPQAS